MAKKKLADVNAAENWLNDDLPNILELDVYNCDEFAKIENEQKIQPRIMYFMLWKIKSIKQ